MPTIGHPLWLANANAATYTGQTTYDSKSNLTQPAPKKVFSQAMVAASTYGFVTSDATGLTNLAALYTWRDAANTAGFTFIKFAPGNYNIKVPHVGDPGYIGSSGPVALFTGILAGVVDAGQATFTFLSDDRPSLGMICFEASSNIDIVIKNMIGSHSGTTTTGAGSGVRGMWLTRGNSNFDITFRAQTMFEGIRIAEYEDPASPPASTMEGNHDINVWCSVVDTFYGVPCYLASNLIIYCESKGTPAGNYGCYRAVYLTGCSNVRAVSRTQNMSTPDGVNIIGSAPRLANPQHIGCTNIWLDATDLGTNRYVQYQYLVKMAIVSCTVSNISAAFSNINVNVSLTMSATVWGANSVVAFGAGAALPTGAHTFQMNLSGLVKRLSYIADATIKQESTPVGLTSVTLNLINFHDLYYNGSKPISIYVPGSASTVAYYVNSYASDVQTASFSNGGIQTLTVKY
jgi:hypothetical protein